MEFWSAEVKSGETFKVVPGDGMVLHLSQASLGEMKKEKGNESVCLFVSVEGKKLVLGTLFSDKLPQQQFDLVFDNNFELSHNWKSGSVYFFGYKATNPLDEDELPGGVLDESSDSEEDIPNTLATNGKPLSKAKPEKPAETGKAVAAKGKDSNSGKQKVQIVEPPKGVKPQDDDDDSSGDDGMMSEEDESEEEDDEDDSGDESDESDEETPKKVEPSKKRAAESKTPVSDKRAKVTPQKTDEKKGGVHVATPYPKQANKTPANKPNQQTPKGAGSSSHSCKTCNRTFGSDKALESHSKAKHGA
ncbi:histone deacetylase HDT1-like [Henckelia pumila]|uniref:histone deacetylase HDT1-like n=1 Tax=Henckelia pumila TaxID=405737 RepID=UPI003C6E1795